MDADNNIWFKKGEIFKTRMAKAAIMPTIIVIIIPSTIVPAPKPATKTDTAATLMTNQRVTVSKASLHTATEATIASMMLIVKATIV